MIFGVLCVFSPLQSGLSRIACATNKPQTRDLSKPQRSLPILPSAALKAGSGKGRKRNLKSSKSSIMASLIGTAKKSAT